MLTTRAKVSHGLVAVTLLLLGGPAVWGIDATPGKAAEPTPRAAPGPVKENNARLKTLLADRLAVAREMAAQEAKAYQAGTAPFTRLHEANLGVLHAELDLCERDKDRVAVLEKFVAAAKQLEEQVARQHKAALVPASAVSKAKLARLEAEIALERAKIKAADPTK